MINRVKAIKEKGFSMTSPKKNDSTTAEFVPVDFSKIKVGLKSLKDAVVNLGQLKKINPRLADKTTVIRAIEQSDLDAMREISNFFYKTSGIYSRLCRYLAYLYRYDWLVTPYIINGEVNKNKLLKEFSQILVSLDNFEVKRNLGDIALKVIRNGCYYAYILNNNNSISLQELPAKYCRSRYSVNGRPAVEFNMKFFDDTYKDAGQKMRILGLFPQEFRKGYLLYKEGKLEPEFPGDKAGWYLLDPAYTIKFNMNGEDYPTLISVIPSIIDLDAAQDLDRQKMAQQLLKIIIQKMPLDKNGDLVFDVDEAQELHNNAVQMLGKAIGIDVLTTFAEVDVADMADKNSVTRVDDLQKVERTVYNESGTAQNLFNTDGNIALEKSIANDEASIYNLLLQFESFLNYLIIDYNKNKKVNYKVQLLTTTIYNYKDLSKMYKEHTQMGYSKLLPQIALGQSQSSILANAYFENSVLDLVNMFIPPMTSNTMNADALNKSGSGSGSNDKKNKINDDKKAGRKEKADEEKSDKTIANRESMS